jgi:hypothetical protein
LGLRTASGHRVVYSPGGGDATNFAIKFFGAEGNEHHREIEIAREISFLYTLLVGRRGRRLGIALVFLVQSVRFL